VATVYLDPSGIRRTCPTAYRGALDLDRPRVPVTLIANNFPGAVEFLDHVEKALADIAPQLEMGRIDRGPLIQSSAALDGDQMELIRQQALGAILAYGH
jgi:hypothetical protein